MKSCNQRALAEAASDFFEQDLRELKSNSRLRRLAWPRNICMYIADRAQIKKSLIGRFWNRDRTIVYNAIIKVKNDLDVDPKRRHQFFEFSDYLKERDIFKGHLIWGLSGINQFTRLPNRSFEYVYSLLISCFCHFFKRFFEVTD